MLSNSTPFAAVGVGEGDGDIVQIDGCCSRTSHSHLSCPD